MAGSGAGYYTESTRDLRWSRAEKAAAKRAFDRALEKEFAEVIAEAKRMAAKIRQPSDLWELEDFLAERREKIDRRYDYRYSVLLQVFADLINEGG